MQLAKYLCSFGRVIYDSLEESTGLSFQMSLKRHKMGEVKKKLIILDGNRWSNWRNGYGAEAVPES